MNLDNEKRELYYLEEELASLPNSDEAQILLNEVRDLIKEIKNAKGMSKVQKEKFIATVKEKVKRISYDKDGIFDTLPESELM